MIFLYIRVKFRAFGFTIKTVEETLDISSVIVMILRKWSPLFPALDMIAGEVDHNGMIGRDLSLGRRFSVYDDHGIFIEFR